MKISMKTVGCCLMQGGGGGGGREGGRDISAT